MRADIFADIPGTQHKILYHKWLKKPPVRVIELAAGGRGGPGRIPGG